MYSEFTKASDIVFHDDRFSNLILIGLPPVAHSPQVVEAIEKHIHSEFSLRAKEPRLDGYR